MAYVFQSDPTFIAEGPWMAPGEYGPSTIFDPGFENIWQAWARESGIEPTEGKGDETRYSPAYTQWKAAKQAEGFDIGMEYIPGVKNEHNFTILKNSQPVSEPIRLKSPAAGSFSSVFSGMIKDFAPALLPALTAGLTGPLAGALGVSTPVASGLIGGGVTALGGGDIGDIAKNALLAGAGSYASQALQGATGGLTPEMQATISSSPQGAFLGESAIPLAGSAGDMMTGVDMSGNIVNSLTGEVLLPAIGAAGAGAAGIAEGMAPGVLAPATAAELAGTEAVLAGAGAAGAGAAGAGAAGAGAAGAGDPTRAALYGDAGYGEGMTGAETSAYDAGLAAGAGAAGAGAAGAGAAGAGAAGAGAAGAAGSAAAGAAGAAAADSIWGPLISSLASLYGGQQTAEAANRAAELYSQQMADALQLQRDIYEQGVERQRPFLEQGKAAFNRLVGLQTGGPEAAQNFLTMDPGYGFRLSEGMKALERQQAARGNLLSGGALKAGQRYAQDVASQEYGNAYNRLAQLANVGPAAAGVTNALGQQYATGASNLMSQQGQVGANALLTGAAARQSAYGDIGQIWGKYLGG